MQFFSNNLNAFCRIPSSRLSLCPLSPNILLLAFWTFRYMFVISFSIFITSNEINLRNYGNIVVHCRTHMPGIWFLLFQFYFSLDVFFFFGLMNVLHIHIHVEVFVCASACIWFLWIRDIYVVCLKCIFFILSASIANLFSFNW